MRNLLLIPAILFGISNTTAPDRSAQNNTHIARLYVYTDQNIRPRHRAIVSKALEKRAETHTSTFAKNGTKGKEPLLELGPVTSRARLWKWRSKEKRWDHSTSSVAWPFVALLEYDGTEKPEAYIDWFRRPTSSSDKGAWISDPTFDRYAQHMNAQTFHARDDRYAYMAIADAPSTLYVKEYTWVVRARVSWKNDATETRSGWVLRLHTPKSKPWHAKLLPLVDWTATPSKGKKDVFKTNRRLLEKNQLGVFGTTTVFSFPPIPKTVVPGRGF